MTSHPFWRLVILAMTAALPLFSCAPIPARARAASREADYFARHREVLPSIATAIRDGHVLVGMDREQVWTVLGDPWRKALKGQNGDVQVWLYGGHKLHQDQLHSHGADLFRLVFVNGRLQVIEPI